MLPAPPPLLKSLTNIFNGWLCCRYELLIHRLSSLGLITNGNSSVTIFHAGLPEEHAIARDSSEQIIFFSLRENIF
jgi:hypothetical protein